MSLGGYKVEVTNLSPVTTERELYDFFSFSGTIEHIEIIRFGERASTAYVTFREPHALETALLLTGATIRDQPVCIARWGSYDEPQNFWDRQSWNLEEDFEFTTARTSHFISTPSEALTMAQEVVKTMLSEGYNLSKDALIKAKAFDESYHVSATATAADADLSSKIGLTDKIYASVDAIRSVDDRYHVSETTKTVLSVAGRTVSIVANSVVNSSYFSAGALVVSDALSRAAKAAADLATRGSKC